MAIGIGIIFIIIIVLIIPVLFFGDKIISNLDTIIGEKPGEEPGDVPGEILQPTEETLPIEEIEAIEVKEKECIAGANAAPKVKYTWKWGQIGTDFCEKYFCDQTQFSIVLVKKLHSFLQGNGWLDRKLWLTELIIFI